jgi:hypothetical protein
MLPTRLRCAVTHSSSSRRLGAEIGSATDESLVLRTGRSGAIAVEHASECLHWRHFVSRALQGAHSCCFRTGAKAVARLVAAAPPESQAQNGSRRSGQLAAGGCPRPMGKHRTRTRCSRRRQSFDGRGNWRSKHRPPTRFRRTHHTCRWQRTRFAFVRVSPSIRRRARPGLGRGRQRVEDAAACVGSPTRAERPSFPEPAALIHEPSTTKGTRENDVLMDRGGRVVHSLTAT